MNEQYFKCILIDDVVLNASLATEGNMESLDYIPGSNFLGIVANKLYEENNGVDIFKLCHTGDLSYGDALPAIKDAPGYAMPFAFFQDKLKSDLEKGKVYVHHGLPKKSKWQKEPVIVENNRIQLKQQRVGFFNKRGEFISKPQKAFYLKSAYDPKERRSADSKMFGFDALKKGQTFIFSLQFSNKVTEEEKNEVKDILEGKHRIGKSKTAQFGRVEIKAINEPEIVENKHTQKNKQLVVYAASNLCLLNEYGQPCLTPKLEDFNLENIATPNLRDTQIRTHTYSPWNSKRNTTDTQRNVILKGSVMVFDLDEEVSIDDLPTSVGEYQAEGMGRVIYNPEFLVFNEEGISDIKFKDIKKGNDENSDNKTDKVLTHTKLGNLLAAKRKELNEEKEIGEKIHDVLTSDDYQMFFDKDISNSQWGEIRSMATQEKDIEELIFELFGEVHKKTKNNNGYLMHGVAAEKVWDKKGGSRRNKLFEVIDKNKNLGTEFVAKLAAEIPKYKDSNKSK
ncbi:MAG: hypothetical protein U9Q98_06820 [Bacteroidota bacterium]|nr:hypothetical protein [Bacteroidota bacterium]